MFIRYIYDHIYHIAVSAAALSVIGGFVFRKVRRNMKFKNLALEVASGNLHVQESHIMKHGVTRYMAVVVGKLDEEDVVFNTFTCSVTGEVKEVKFWIGKEAFEERIELAEPGKEKYLGLTLALDKYLRKEGKTSVLPEITP